MFLIKKNQQQTVRFCELIYKYLSRKFKLVNYETIAMGVSLKFEMYKQIIVKRY